MKKIFYFYSVLVLLSGCTSKFSRILKSKDNELKYKMAEQYYANKKYYYALQIFEELFPYIKGTDRYEDMYFKFALSHYFEKDYTAAENYFKQFAELFPLSKRAEECEYLRANCYYKQSPKVDLDQTTTKKSMALFQAFINTHPTSSKLNEANEMIDVCREKLELKEYKSAELYYNLGYYKAAAIAFSNVAEDFPESKKSDSYKLEVIKSYLKYAELSFEEKQEERYLKVLAECTDFSERFIDSKYITEVNKYKNQTNNFLKKIKNEQNKKANRF